ncbi:DNA-3-methyladenine glycosylase [Luteolibacter algae]|uniref:Putative 3-methyladenine DNA glycosylase n=1 Tax=Luteolibacter algae TaxID=454151 RepID=A0ABW5D3Q7_9BACT
MARLRILSDITKIEFGGFGCGAMAGFSSTGKAESAKRHLHGGFFYKLSHGAPRMERLSTNYFENDPVECARGLIGAVFQWNGCSGRIVETEGYRAAGDEACHTWHRNTARKFIAERRAGDAYVYLNYGVHWLFNVLVKSEGESGFVLIRALEPLTGIEQMQSRRGNLKLHQLTSGPGKLTRALGIDGTAHGESFLQSGSCGIFTGTSGTVVSGPRIGISKAIDLPWRFGEKGSPFLSCRFQ